MSKVDELKEKFQGFIEDLKKKLPSKGKGSDDDDDFDDDEDFDEDTGQVEIDPSQMGEDIDAQDATETDINEVPQSDDDDDDDFDDEDDDEDDEDDEDEDEKKKKQKSLLIKVVLGVLVAVLLYDQFMPADDPPLQQVNVQKKKKRKKRRNRKKKVAKANKDGAQKKTEPKMDAPKKQAVAPVATPAPKPVAIATPAPTPVAVATPAPTPVVVATPAPTPVAVATPAPKPVAVATPAPKPMTAKTNDATGIPPETPSEPLNMKVGEQEIQKTLTMDDKVDAILEKSKEAEQMKKAMEKKDTMVKEDIPEEYVSPPNYKRLGRGLVYNCVGRHWACVDKFSYFQCRENSVWSKGNAKKPECATKNVYASEKDCGVVQLHYINTNEPTEFCDRVDDSTGNDDVSTKVMVQ